MTNDHHAAGGTKPHPLKTPFGCFAAAFAGLAALVVGFLIYLSFSLTPAERPDDASSLPAITARVSAEQAVQAMMNDPRSYRYVSHTVQKVVIVDGVEGYKVDLVFRGKNAFGGVVLDTATVTTDEEGLMVLSIE